MYIHAMPIIVATLNCGFVPAFAVLPPSNPQPFTWLYCCICNALKTKQLWLFAFPINTIMLSMLQHCFSYINGVATLTGGLSDGATSHILYQKMTYYKNA